LAFAQMFYFLASGLEGFGGDDGMSLFAGSDFGLFRLDTPLALYYTAFGVLLLALAALHRLVHAPFGMVLRGCQANERRMRALGFATLRYRLAAYVLSAMVCGVAGVLLANLTLYVSPSYLAWTTSGELIVMVALGGLGTVVGPVAGALAFLLLEEGLKLLTDHWMLVMGLLIVGVVLVSRRGLYGGLPDAPLRLRAARPLPHPTGEPR
ncbi:branched-chain amino acid ABC transporter permease, partial [Achromobacter insuavis]|uniref:branched-chain amino acid ABC transporter permease n=1 Tax=Achromobacter insuavis TaxID=1287735 RepID=UPI0035A1B0F1